MRRRAALLALAVGIAVLLGSWTQNSTTSARAMTLTCSATSNDCSDSVGLSGGGYLQGDDYYGFPGCGNCWWVEGDTYTFYANSNYAIYVYTAGWDSCTDPTTNGWVWDTDTGANWLYNGATNIYTSEYQGYFDTQCYPDDHHAHGISDDHERWHTNGGQKEAFSTYSPIEAPV